VPKKKVEERNKVEGLPDGGSSCTNNNPLIIIEFSAALQTAGTKDDYLLLKAPTHLPK
jgi:hypothetical protein